MRFAHFVSLAIKTWGCWRVDAPRLKKAYSSRVACLAAFVYHGSDFYKNGHQNMATAAAAH